jgi:hypothetical protein
MQKDFSTAFSLLQPSELRLLCLGHESAGTQRPPRTPTNKGTLIRGELG